MLKLRFLRESHGLTQEELGRELGVTGSAIGSWENDVRTPDLDTLITLADYFRVSLDYLVGRSEKGKVQEPGIRKTVKVLEELTPEQREKVLEIVKVLWG